MTAEPLLAAVAGAIAGSFLSTFAVRQDRGGSVLHGRSRCDRCGVRVPAHANVPVLAYLWLRGRCGACGGAIDPRHPLLEIGCLLLAVAAVAARPGPAGWGGALFGWLLATLAVVDARRFRLPDVLTLPLAVVGIAFAILAPPPPLVDRLWGVAGGYAALRLVALGYRAMRGREGLGRGDAKLLAAIGAWLGWQPLPAVVAVAATIGLGWAGIRVLSGRRVSGTDMLPFGTLLALAAWPAWWIAA